MGIRNKNKLIAIIAASGIGQSLAGKSLAMVDEPEETLKAEPNPFDTTPSYIIKPNPFFTNNVLILYPSKSMCPKDYGMSKQRKKFKR
jgi:hypothetical protein